MTLIQSYTLNLVSSGRDDAEEAGWISVKKALSSSLAFDHKQIILDSLSALGI